MQKKPVSILFICPYPTGESPSQRFRFEQYFELLRKQPYQIEVQTFWSAKAWSALYKEGHVIQKIFGLLGGYCRRFFMLSRLQRFDFVFIHREAAPLGPPIWEWIAAKILKRKIIYDFDDAIWLPNTSEENRWVAWIKWHTKVSSICRWSYKVSCGNHFLCEYARRFNSQVIYNPTTIDTESLHNPHVYPAREARSKVVIGWTGSHSTLAYLSLIKNVLHRLESEYNNLEIIIIANKQPDLGLKTVRFIPWNKNQEGEDLMKIDIGIMPLSDDIWSRGKCGFKALQYLALGIPTIASPVGVNTDIIEHGKNGYLCTTDEEWFLAFQQLIANEKIRHAMGQHGQRFVQEHYSVVSNSTNVLRLFA
ncbi:MAG: glycosyltransferase family 4 protein [Bacteroidota bacterium]